MKKALLLICLLLVVFLSLYCLYRISAGGHARPVASVAFSPDGKTLVSGSYDGNAKLWDVAIGDETAKAHARTGGVLCVAFSPNGRMVAFGGSRVEIWDITTGNIVTAGDGQCAATSVAFSPDSKTLAVGAPSAGQVILCDLATMQVAASLSYEGTYPDDMDAVSSVAFSPNGKNLAFGHLDNGEVTLWDVAGGKEATTVLGHDGSRILSVAFSPDGKSLATGSQNGLARIWDVATRKCVHIMHGHAQPVNSVAFSPDGKTLATADSALRLWDVATEKEFATLQGHTAEVKSLAFSPDGKTLASGSMDNTVKLWEVRTQREIWSH
jgi:WD40 repeat protein